MKCGWDEMDGACDTGEIRMRRMFRAETRLKGPLGEDRIILKEILMK